MSRALQRFDRPRKKTVAATERNEAVRQNWRAVAETLPAQRVTLLDESGTPLDMTSRYGRAPRGERVYAAQRRNTGKNMTLLAGITLDGMTAAWVVEGSVTTAVLDAGSVRTHSTGWISG